MSLRTKNKMADSLISLLETHKLDNLTISDIVEKAGVNRQTFYYHFKDLRDFIIWIFENRIFNNDPNVNVDNWYEFVSAMLDNMVKYKTFVYESFHSKNYFYFEKKLQEYIYTFVKSVINNSKNLPITDAETEYYSHFYSYCVSGITLSWVMNNKMEEDPKISLDMFNKYTVKRLVAAAKKYDK